MTSAPATRPTVHSSLFSDLILERQVVYKSRRNTASDTAFTEQSAKEFRQKQEASNHFYAAVERRRSSQSCTQDHVAKPTHNTIALLDNLVMAPVSLITIESRLMNVANTIPISQPDSKKRKMKEQNASHSGKKVQTRSNQAQEQSKGVAAASKRQLTVHRRQIRAAQSTEPNAKNSAKGVYASRESSNNNNPEGSTPLSMSDHASPGGSMYNPITFGDEEIVPSVPSTGEHRVIRELAVKKVEAPGTDSKIQKIQDDEQRRLIEQFQARLKRQEKIIADRQKTIDGQQKRITEYEKATKEQQDKLQAQQHDIDSQQKSIETLHETTENQRGTFDRLKGELGSYHTTIEKKDKNINELEIRVTELQTELDRARKPQSVVPVDGTLAEAQVLLTPQASPGVESFDTEEDKKVENIRRTYVKLQARFHRLQKAATDLVSCTRSMDTSNFGDFGRCLDRLQSSVEQEYMERHAAMASATGGVHLRDGGPLDSTQAVGGTSPL